MFPRMAMPTKVAMNSFYFGMPILYTLYIVFFQPFPNFARWTWFFNSQTVQQHCANLGQ